MKSITLLTLNMKQVLNWQLAQVQRIETSYENAVSCMAFDNEGDCLITGGFGGFKARIHA